MNVLSSITLWALSFQYPPGLYPGYDSSELVNDQKSLDIVSRTLDMRIVDAEMMKDSNDTSENWEEQAVNYREIKLQIQARIKELQLSN